MADEPQHARPPLPVPEAHTILRALRTLLERGTISRSDYEAKKAEVLERL